MDGTDQHIIYLSVPSEWGEKEILEVIAECFLEVIKDTNPQLQKTVTPSRRAVKLQNITAKEKLLRGRMRIEVCLLNMVPVLRMLIA